MCLGLIFSTQAGHLNILFIDLYLATFCPPLLIIMELVFVFYVYGGKTWRRNFGEMTDIHIYNSTLYIVLSIIVITLICWVICSCAAFSTTLSNMFLNPLGPVMTLTPLIVFLMVAVVKLFKIEGKCVKTKLRIGLQSNLEECSCHKLLRGCPFRKYS